MVVKEQTSESIAKAIEALEEMPVSERSTMGLKARMVAEKYSQPYLVDELIKVLKYVETHRENGGDSL